MKLLHTADLHIGKVVHGYSMLEEQRYILEQIIKIAKEEKVEVLLIAGDIYDRAIPPVEAVELLDYFFRELTKEKIIVCAIAGNHDSGERLNFANQLLEEKGLILTGTWNGTIKQVDFEDEFGKIHFFLLPFIKTSFLKEQYQREEKDDYHTLLENFFQDISYQAEERNVLAAHLFVTENGKEPELSDSENRIQVGTIESVESYLLKDFDYVALGHIHKPQKIGKESIYYAGSPLKYSFSEVNHKKSVNIIEILEKGRTRVRKRELIPLHDMRKIKGQLSDLIQKEVVNLENPEDFLSVTLTNREELIDAVFTLRSVYPNVMQVLFEKNNSQEVQEKEVITWKEKTDLEILEEFYEYVRGEKPDNERKEMMKWAVEQAREERER